VGSASGSLGKFFLTWHRIRHKTLFLQDYQTGTSGIAFLCPPPMKLISLEDIEIALDSEIEIS